MRKLIIVVLLGLMILCGAILYGPVVSLVPEWQKVTAREQYMPEELREDIVYVRENKDLPLTIEFSHDEFFYDEDIEVAILSNDVQAEIYYTTDSSTPTKDSVKYIQPLKMNVGKEESCTVVKAIAIEKNGDGHSEVLTHSYFLGKNIKDRFTSEYVFSLSTEEEHLYDYETGILVPGKNYDEFMTREDAEEVRPWHRDANYTQRGHEWERPVYVEAFSRGGERLIAQNAGLRVNGGATRSFEQKSLRLIARKKYEPKEGKFKYPFFENFTTANIYKRPIKGYDTLVLRNDGNDFFLGRLRSPLVSLVAKAAGFDVVTPYGTTAVFLNGEYYGYATVDVRINEQFLEDLYEAPERAFDIVDGGNHKVTTDNKDIVSEFKKLVKHAENGNIEEIEKNFDVDNLLLYYAIEIYLSNSDWPRNNMKLWRYTEPQEEVITKELDGRWRFILYDLDQAMNYSVMSTPDYKTIHRLLDNEGNDPTIINYMYSPIFKALMAEPKYVEKFANNICDLAYEHFSINNVQEVIKKINEVSLEEIEISAELYDISIEAMLSDRDMIIDFIEQRPAYILEELKEFFGYTDMYQIKTDGSCKINTSNKDEGQYFVESHVPITPILKRGEEFDYWIVNGKEHLEKELSVSAMDANDDGIVNVKAVYRKIESPLIFIDTYDNGEKFGFTMYNPNDSLQSIQDLYLSDNVNELKKWKFPDLNIGINKKWDFVGKNVTAYDALLKVKLNFNPRVGEMIFLSNEQGKVLDYILMEP